MRPKIPRYRLRTLLVLVGLIAVPLAYVGNVWQRDLKLNVAASPRRGVEKQEANDRSVGYEPDTAKPAGEPASQG